MKQQAILILRWLLLPILFYLVGQYLEGPPTRVLVHGVLFTVCSFAVSLFAGQFLWRQHKKSLWVVFSAGILVPAGFIFAIQNYYNGATNSDYVDIVRVFSALMILNGVVYIYSLFRPENKKTLSKPGTIKSYDIKLHSLNGNEEIVGLKYQDNGEGSPPHFIILDGFSQDKTISLEKHLQNIHENHIEHYQTLETVRETIIKFGQTMQLVDNYLLEINITFK